MKLAFKCQYRKVTNDGVFMGYFTACGNCIDKKYFMTPKEDNKDVICPFCGRIVKIHE